MKNWVKAILILAVWSFNTNMAQAQTKDVTFGKKEAAAASANTTPAPAGNSSLDDELGGDIKTTDAAPAAEKPRKDALFSISLLGDFTLDGPTDRQRVYEGTLRLRGCKSLRPTHDLEGVRIMQDVGLCMEADVGGGKDFYRERIGEPSGIAGFGVRGGAYAAFKPAGQYLITELLAGGDWSSQDGNRGVTFRSTTRGVLFPKNNTPRYDMVKLYGYLEPVLTADFRFGKSRHTETVLTPAVHVYPIDIGTLEIGVLGEMQYTWLREPTATAVAANALDPRYTASGASYLGGVELRGYSSGLSEWKAEFKAGGGKFGPEFHFGTTFTW